MRLTCLPFKTSFPPFLHFRASKCPTNMPSKHICRIRRIRIIYFRLFQVSFKSKLVLSRIQLFKIYPERKKLRRATFFYLWMINFAFDRISWNRNSLFQYWLHIDSMADSQVRIHGPKLVGPGSGGVEIVEGVQDQEILEISDQTGPGPTKSRTDSTRSIHGHGSLLLGVMPDCISVHRWLRKVE